MCRCVVSDVKVCGDECADVDDDDRDTQFGSYGGGGGGALPLVSGCCIVCGWPSCVRGCCTHTYTFLNSLNPLPVSHKSHKPVSPYNAVRWAHIPQFVNLLPRLSAHCVGGRGSEGTRTCGRSGGGGGARLFHAPV